MSKVKHSVHADPFFDPILDRFFLSQLGAHFSCSLYERESTVIFEIVTELSVICTSDSLTAA